MQFSRILIRAYYLLIQGRFRQLVGNALTFVYFQTFCRARQYFQSIYYRVKYGHAAPKSDYLIWINPSEIRYAISPNFRWWFSSIGTYIVDGDWDKTFADKGVQLTPRSGSFVNRYGKVQRLYPISDNLHYKLLCQAASLNSEDPTRLAYERKRLESVRLLIKLHGYKTQRELLAQKKVITPFPRPEFDEIRVNIGRSGEIIFDDGRHRFAVAAHLMLDRIPVRVFVRHKKWQEIRTRIAAGETIAGVSETHPDLQDVINLSRLD